MTSSGPAPGRPGGTDSCRCSRDLRHEQGSDAGNPGSACPKRYLAFDTTYSDIPLCTASTKYINIKLDELKAENLSEEEFGSRYERLTEKECLCNGLSNSGLVANNLDIKMEGEAVSICPGPNMAYFSNKFSLKEMVDHIYGRINILNSKNRPNMFIKELKMYIDYLKTKVEEASYPFSDKQSKYFDTFNENLNNGIEYYKKMFAENRDHLKDTYDKVMSDLENLELELKQYMLQAV